MEKTVKGLTVKTGQLSKDVDNNYNEFLDVKESHLEKIEMNSQGLKEMGTHKSRISKLEDDLIELGILFEKSKTEGQVDYDALCSKKEYLDVLELIKGINTKNSE